MTSLATEVSLHCMICYEEFDLKDRYPVVLPCGHTYVCNVCAKRLTKCMECREPLFWNPPKVPHQHSLPSHHRSPAHPRYPSRTVGRMSAARYSASPQTPTHPSMAAANSNTTNNSVSNTTGTAMDDPQPLPLPKNLVLMEMIEAKERQQRLLREARRQQKQVSRIQQKQHDNQQDEYEAQDDSQNLIDSEPDDDDEEEEEWLVDPALSGMAAFTGSCGTYVVREPLGLVVLPQDPNRRHQQTASPQPPPAKTSTKMTSPMVVLVPAYPLPMKAPQPPPTTPDQDEKKEPGPKEVDDQRDHPQPIGTGKSYHHPQPFFNQDEIFDASGEEGDDNSDVSSPDTAVKPTTTSLPYREPFSIQEGQKVQVVGVDEGVYQLARGAGYIVATVNQLVKVGGPLETSCKLEGMLQSVTRKQSEVRAQLEEINRLASGLREKIKLEQANPEEHPVISLPNNAGIGDSQLHARSKSHHFTVLDKCHPTTPTRHRTANDSSPTTGGSGGNQSTLSNTSTHVELGAPRTPGLPQSSADGPFLEMGHGSGSGSYSCYDQYVNSPAHSCPMPTIDATANLNQPFIDGTTTGLPRYRVNSDDDMYGMGWAGALGCGSSLFGERLLESSRHGASNILNAAGNDILALSFDEHSLLDNPTTRHRVAALAAAAGAHTGLQDSPLRSGGSFDGVNFRTGMSGHSGVSQPKRNRNAHHTGLTHSSATLPPRQIRMMSEHRGVAHVRGTGLASGFKRRTTPDAMVGYQDYY